MSSLNADDSMFTENWSEPIPQTHDSWYYSKMHSDVAYRIYLGSHVQEPCVVCVQEFDLKDYEDAWFKTQDGEDLELQVYVYHYHYQSSSDPDGETETLVEKYMKDNWKEVMRQYNANRVKMGYTVEEGMEVTLNFKEKTLLKDCIRMAVNENLYLLETDTTDTDVQNILEKLGYTSQEIKSIFN